MNDNTLSRRLGSTPPQKEHAVQYQPREYVTVVLHTVTGEDIEADLSLPKDGSGIYIRPLDLLERDTERLLRLRNATIINKVQRITVAALAVSKQAVVRMHEKRDVQSVSWQIDGNVDNSSI